MLRRWTNLLFIVALVISFQDFLFAMDYGEQEDPNGIRFVEDVLQYKGIRRYPVKKTNDAEQLFIKAIELLKDGHYEDAFRNLKEAVRRDSAYLNAHFILAGLYERKGDLKNMEKEYRYYMKKTIVFRKWLEGRTALKDRRILFISEKFDRYGIPLKEPTYRQINVKYWARGAIFIVAIFLIIMVLVHVMRDILS